MSVTIYHNPDCGTSRNTLAMIRASGEEPVVVEYLHVGWTPELLRRLSKEIGVPLRDLIREKGTPACELALLDDAVSDEAIISAMVDHPIIVNRPIVAAPKGTRLCRPSEVVLGLLDNPPTTFTKEDGEVVVVG